MEREVIPPEKYVQKALIDQIFSTTVGNKSNQNSKMAGYFKILKKNLLDSITIKKSKEEQKNQFIQIKSAKGISSWNKIFTSNKVYSANIADKKSSRKGLTKIKIIEKF